MQSTINGKYRDFPYIPCPLTDTVVWSLSRAQPFATPQTVAHQAHLFVAFSRQEYWSGLPFPSPGDLPNPGIEPASPALAGGFFTVETPGKHHTGTASPILNILPP